MCFPGSCLIREEHFVRKVVLSEYGAESSMARALEMVSASLLGTLSLDYGCEWLADQGLLWYIVLRKLVCVLFNKILGPPELHK